MLLVTYTVLAVPIRRFQPLLPCLINCILYVHDFEQLIIRHNFKIDVFHVSLSRFLGSCKSISSIFMFYV
jgi:hypothetical protein